MARYELTDAGPEVTLEPSDLVLISNCIDGIARAGQADDQEGMEEAIGDLAMAVIEILCAIPEEEDDDDDDEEYHAGVPGHPMYVSSEFGPQA